MPASFTGNKPKTASSLVHNLFETDDPNLTHRMITPKSYQPVVGQ